MSTLLTYAVSTTPSTLQVSASTTDPSAATLTIAASLLQGSCTLSQLRFQLVVDATSLDSTVLSTTEPSATINSSDGTSWTIGQGDRPGEFVAQPSNGPVTFAGQGLSIEFTGITVSTVTGVSPLTVDEWAVPSAPGEPTFAALATGPTTGTTILKIAKFPVGFTFDDLVATPSSVYADRRSQLSWTGPSNENTSYVISWNGQEVECSGSPWTTPRLQQNTQFSVQIRTVVAGQTLTRTRTVLVSVQRPVVNDFSATPDAVDPSQTVMLSWTTTDAESFRVYEKGVSKPLLTLEAESNGNGVPFQPKYGASYVGIAVAQQGGATVTSPQYDLWLTFNPVRIASFTAAPTTLAGAVNASTLSWDVEAAASLTLNGQPVTGDGATVSPMETTAYTLTATGASGATVSETLNITVDTPGYVTGQTATMTVDGADIVIVANFLTSYSTLLTINTATIYTPYIAPFPMAAAASGVPDDQGNAIIALRFAGAAATFGNESMVGLSLTYEASGIGVETGSFVWYAAAPAAVAETA